MRPRDEARARAKRAAEVLLEPFEDIFLPITDGAFDQSAATHAPALDDVVVSPPLNEPTLAKTLHALEIRACDPAAATCVLAPSSVGGVRTCAMHGGFARSDGDINLKDGLLLLGTVAHMCDENACALKRAGRARHRRLWASHWPRALLAMLDAENARERGPERHTAMRARTRMAGELACTRGGWRAFESTRCRVITSPAPQACCACSHDSGTPGGQRASKWDHWRVLGAKIVSAGSFAVTREVAIDTARVLHW